MAKPTLADYSHTLAKTFLVWLWQTRTDLLDEMTKGNSFIKHAEVVAAGSTLQWAELKGIVDHIGASDFDKISEFLFTNYLGLQLCARGTNSVFQAEKLWVLTGTTYCPSDKVVMRMFNHIRDDWAKIKAGDL